MGVARRALGPWFPIRHGFASRLRRPRAPDFGRPQNFGSKDNFQHFCKQLYLYYCFGSTHVFSLCRYSPVAKPQIFGEPCNTVRTKFFLLFPYLRGVLFENLDDATLSSLGNTPNTQIKLPLRKILLSSISQSLCMLSK